MSLTWWMRPGLPRFLRSSASMYYTECKLKNKNRGGLGTRPVSFHCRFTTTQFKHSWSKLRNSCDIIRTTKITPLSLTTQDKLFFPPWDPNQLSDNWLSVTCEFKNTQQYSSQFIVMFSCTQTVLSPPQEGVNLSIRLACMVIPVEISLTKNNGAICGSTLSGKSNFSQHLLREILNYYISQCTTSHSSQFIVMVTTLFLYTCTHTHTRIYTVFLQIDATLEQLLSSNSSHS